MLKDINTTMTYSMHKTILDHNDAFFIRGEKIYYRGEEIAVKQENEFYWSVECVDGEFTKVTFTPDMFLRAVAECRLRRHAEISQACE
tara:strand:- start:354 stop:617 length:264 start_codon:yes stop_codon:yes gene_type:complete